MPLGVDWNGASLGTNLDLSLGTRNPSNMIVTGEVELGYVTSPDGGR